jgi:outer membrane protein
VDEQFKNGLKTVVDVLQSRDNMLAAEQDKLQSKYTFLLNLQLLKFYQGEELTL